MTWRLLFCFFFLPGLLSAEEPYKSPELGLTFPSSLGEMKLVKVTDYEKEAPGMGTGLSYRSEKEKADLYIYNGGLSSIPKGVDHSLVRDHFAEITGDVFEMEKRGYYQDVKIVTPLETIKLAELSLLHTEIDFLQGEARVSHIYLTVLNNRFFKIRYTYHASSPETGKKALQALLKSMGEILSKATP